MFPHVCTLTRTISLNYRGISLSFHLVTEVFQLVTRYFNFPLQFQLNSDSHEFLNGQLTCRAVLLLCIAITSDVLQHIWQAS